MSDVRHCIGIDGGGSGCRARIRDSSNALLAEESGGPANFYQDFDGALANVRALIQNTARAARLAPGSLTAGLGLAGLVTSVDPGLITAGKLGVHRAVADVDAYTACLGAFDGSDGGIVIAGTGSIAFGVRNGQRHMAGGWGTLLGDRGSGAWLGIEAVRATTLAHDGFAPHSALTRHVMQRIGNTMFDMSVWSEQATPKDYAAFAPFIFDLAAEGDAPGLGLVREGAREISALARFLLSKGNTRICLLGGLAEAYVTYLDDDIRGSLVPPAADALDGAIMMARGLF